MNLVLLIPFPATAYYLILYSEYLFRAEKHSPSNLRISLIRGIIEDNTTAMENRIVNESFATQVPEVKCRHII